jgi:hypothetical protein
MQMLQADQVAKIRNITFPPCNQILFWMLF